MIVPESSHDRFCSASTETSPWSTSVEMDSQNWRETTTMTRPNVHAHRSLFKSEPHVDSTVPANQRRPPGAQTRGRSPITTLLAAGAEVGNSVVKVDAVEAVLFLPPFLPHSTPIASCMGGWNWRSGSWSAGGERILGGVI